MSVRWTINDQGFSRRFKQLGLEGDAKRTALAAMGSAIANRIRMGFRLGQSPYGVPWRAPNPAFGRGGGQPLRDTGRLSRSITSAVIGNAAVVGTNVIYAKTHQFGATIRPRSAGALAIPLAGGGIVLAQKVTIPARPFMPISGGDVVLPDSWRRSAFDALRRVMQL